VLSLKKTQGKLTIPQSNAEPFA